jgi:type II secretory pathway pseudopilin PulG
MRLRRSIPCSNPPLAAGAGGFTLLEILLASLLLAAVVAVALLVLSVSRAVEGRVRVHIERNEQVQLAFAQMSRALSACLPPGGEYAEGLSATAPEEAEAAAEDAPAGASLTVVSAAGVGPLGGRLRRFTFRFTGAGEEGPGRLVMTVAPVGEDPGAAGDEGDEEQTDQEASAAQSVPLVDGLYDCRFELFDGADWSEEGWDSAGRGGLPALVRVRLWFVRPPEAGQEDLPLPEGVTYSRIFRVVAADPAGGTEEGVRVRR